MDSSFLDVVYANVTASTSKKILSKQSNKLSKNIAVLKGEANQSLKSYASGSILLYQVSLKFP